MSQNPQNSNQDLLSQQAREAIDRWVLKYPSDKKQSALLSALTIVQDENNGFLTESLMDAVAHYLELPKMAVYEVATFYSMFSLKPVGKYKIDVCTNISCQLCNSEAIMAHLQKRLNIKPGETTTDGKFTLREVECLAACTNAPMMQIGKDYHENLSPEKVDQILDNLD